MNKNIMVVGILGKAGAGKDTVARALLHRFGAVAEPRFTEQFAFATLLKETAARMFRLTHSQLYDQGSKEVIDPRWGKSPRTLLQELGSAMRAIHPDVFWRATELEIAEWHEENGSPSKSLAVISDCRHENEAAWIRSVGGVLLRVVRPGAGLSGANATHESETAADAITVDLTLHNSGTLEDLICLAKEQLPVLERWVGRYMRPE